MNHIRKAVYTTALFLSLSALAFTPTPASAQEMRGSFTLAHEVHWQNAVIPAGEYRFTLKSSAPASLLTLSKISGSSGGYMLLVNDTSMIANTASVSRIVLVPRAGGSFVSAMELPEFGATLHFAVPAEAPARIAVTKETATPMAAAQ